MRKNKKVVVSAAAVTMSVLAWSLRWQYIQPGNLDGGGF